MNKNALWANEVKQAGSYGALLDRLRFHNGLSLGYAVEFTGLCQSTIRKHMKRMVENGVAIEYSLDYWKPK